MTGRGPRPARTVSDIATLDAGIAALIAHAHHAPRTVDLAVEEQRKLAAWCAVHGLTAMPAAPVTVAGYLAWMAVGELAEDGAVRRAPYARSTIRIAATGIRLAHQNTGGRSPTEDPFVRDVLRGIARCAWVRGPSQQDPLTHDRLLALVSMPVPLPAVTTVRDRALVLVARATGLPLRLLAALARSAATVTAEHAVLHLAAGPVTVACCCAAPAGSALCPVAALRDLDADLPAAARLAFGVVHDRAGRGRALCYPGPGQGHRVVVAVQAAVRGAGMPPWRATQPLPVCDDAALLRVLAALDADTTRWIRDTAVLLVGWHLALRGGEIGSLLTCELVRDARGYTVMLGRTKSDQLAAGTALSLLPTRDPRLDPVAALDRWLAYRGTTPGPVFTTVRGGRPQPTRALRTRDVSEAVRHRAALAGLAGRYSSHSLRIGFVVGALRLGASVPELMTVTRHRDPSMIGYYGRGELNRRNTVAWRVLGWQAPA